MNLFFVCFFLFILPLANSVDSCTLTPNKVNYFRSKAEAFTVTSSRVLSAYKRDIILMDLNMNFGVSYSNIV